MCEHKNATIILTVGKYEILKCRDCLLVFTRIDSPAETFPAEKYSDYYTQNEGGSSRFFSPVELLIKFIRFMRALQIWILFRPKSVLDIGCGRGYTIYFLQKYFGTKRVEGTQISKPAYESARDRLGQNVHFSDLLDVEFSDLKSFDLVTMWHVIEHLNDPEGYLAKIHGLLADNGTLFFQMPSTDSWTRRLTGQYWLSWDPPFHLYHFDLGSMKMILKRNRYRLKRYVTFSLEYSTFTSVQSLASRITKDKNAFYDFLLKRRKCDRGVMLHIALFVILTIPCFLINVALYLSRYGEVMTIYAEKE